MADTRCLTTRVDKHSIERRNGRIAELADSLAKERAQIKLLLNGARRGAFGLVGGAAAGPVFIGENPKPGGSPATWKEQLRG